MKNNQSDNSHSIPSPPLQSPTRPKIAFVVQRSGAEVIGGAESLCLQIAKKMLPFWEVEILTTCALEYTTWKNHYEPGRSSLYGVKLQRFPVTQERNQTEFDQLSAQLHERIRTCSEEEQRKWMKSQGPNCPSLTTFIAENQQNYKAFFFFGYLYATTFENLPLVRGKAWLVPCAHDEWPIYFSVFDKLFSLPRGIIYNTPPEYTFVQQRFFHLNIEGEIAGVGVDVPEHHSAVVSTKISQLETPFLLYCGRVDYSKGCGEMLNAFLEWKKNTDLPHKLVLIGKSVIPIPEHPDVIPLGFVDETEKWSAMATCDWLLMPSLYESLSLVLLECWAMGRPALVNAKCAVLADHCQRSQAGIAFNEWDTALGAITVCSDTEKLLLGENGRTYVRENYSWSTIIEKFLNTISVK